MNIQPSRKLPAKTPAAKLPKPGPEPEKDDHFWRELFSGELQEIGIHLNPDHIHATVDGAKSIGSGLRDAWEDLGKKVSDLFKLADLDTRISPEFQEKATEVVLQTARGLGYAAAGLQGIGGLHKLRKGIQKKNLGDKIDGVFDLSTSAAVATTVAGMGIGPLVLGPLAATMGVVRGGYNAVKGFRKGDGRLEIQGGLDMVRSASVGLRLLGKQAPGLAVAGKVLGPIAGVIQASRGFYDLSAGLEKADKSKQVQGLSDIAAATGLTLAMTGVGTIPGIALAAVAMGSRVLYQFSDKFQGWADQKLDKWGPGLKTATKAVNKVVNPVIHAVRPLVEKTLGRNRGQARDDKPPD